MPFWDAEKQLISLAPDDVWRFIEMNILWLVVIPYSVLGRNTRFRWACFQFAFLVDSELRLMAHVGLFRANVQRSVGSSDGDDARDTSSRTLRYMGFERLKFTLCCGKIRIMGYDLYRLGGKPHGFGSPDIAAIGSGCGCDCSLTEGDSWASMGRGRR